MLRAGTCAVMLVLALVLGACGGGDDGDGLVGGSCEAGPPAASGEGTYYAATGAGNCSFDPSPDDLMVAAMNAVDYQGAAWCGGCVEVTGPDGVVTVRIVDQCRECAKGDLDLSPEAFARLAPLSAGRIPITWREVACPVSGPVAYHFKDGSNPFWTAIQVRNHRYPIVKVEVAQAGGFVALPRLDYNYFVEDGGLGDGPYTIRVTDLHGHVIEDSGVALGDDVTRTGGGQFPACASLRAP